MGYVMRAQVAAVAEKKMFDTMPKYNNSREIALVWDNLQRNVRNMQLYTIIVFIPRYILEMVDHVRILLFFLSFLMAALLEVFRAFCFFPSRGSNLLVTQNIASDRRQG